MNKLHIAIIISMICVLVAQATEFCSIDVCPTDNLVVFVYKDNDFTQLQDMLVTISETMEGVYVNGELVVKRMQQIYSPEDLLLHSRLEIVKDAVARGVDLYEAVNDYKEQQKRIRDVITTAFINHLQHLSVEAIIPLLEDILDELDPDRSYISRFEPDSRCDHCLFIWTPSDYWLMEQLGTDINPLTITKHSMPEDSRSYDKEGSAAKPFLNCTSIAAMIDNARKERTSSRIYCLIIGGKWGVSDATYVDTKSMMKDIEGKRRI